MWSWRRVLAQMVRVTTLQIHRPNLAVQKEHFEAKVSYVILPKGLSTNIMPSGIVIGNNTCLRSCQVDTSKSYSDYLDLKTSGPSLIVEASVRRGD